MLKPSRLATKGDEAKKLQIAFEYPQQHCETGLISSNRSKHAFALAHDHRKQPKRKEFDDDG